MSIEIKNKLFEKIRKLIDDYTKYDENIIYEYQLPATIFVKLEINRNNKYIQRQINKVEFAEILKISRPTLDKLLKEYLPCPSVTAVMLFPLESF